VVLLLGLVNGGVGIRCEGMSGYEVEKVSLRQYYKHVTCVRTEECDWKVEWRSMVVCRWSWRSRVCV
jgi:hypothetical protein